MVNGSSDEDNNKFHINGDQLFINESPDFERKLSYDIRLQTLDKAGISFAETVTLTVDDLDELVEELPLESSTTPKLVRILGNEITLQFTEELKQTTPHKLRFRVTVDASVATVVETSVEPILGMVFLRLKETPSAKASIILHYSDTKGDQDSGVIELSNGLDIGNLDDIEVLNDISQSVAPVLVTAEVSNSLITLGFNEAINQNASTFPSVDIFKVKVNGRNAETLEISSGSNTGTLNLRLKDNVLFADEVTLSYRDLENNQETGVIQNLVGNDLLTFSNIDVTNNNFVVSELALASAFIEGSRLEVNFDREIAETKPSARVFRVEADGKKLNIKSVDVITDDRQVVLELQKPVTDKQAVTISYTDPKDNQRKNVVEDIQGNDLISFTKQPVGNDTQDTIPLLLDQGEVVDADQILLNFSKELNDISPAASRFKVLVNKKRNKVASIQMNADEGQVILNLKKAIADGDTVTLSYKDLAKDQKRKIIEDTSGNDLASVNNFSIENFVIDADPPLIDDAEFSNDQITLYFNEELADAKVKNSRFKVSVDGKRNKVSSIDIPKEDTIVNLTLRKKIKADSDMLITHKGPNKDPKKGVLEDLAGNNFESFRDFLAEHIDDGDGPLLRTVSGEELLRGLFETNPVLEGIERQMGL